MEKIIEVSGLKKNYGKVQAVKGLDFYVEKGKLFAFLGPNGAGKSTSIDIICTLLKPDAGHILVNGYELGKQDTQIRSSIGVVFQDSLLDGMLTVRENLWVRASFYGLNGKKRKEAVARAIETAGVGEYANRLYGKLSGGQRRRADIARALVNTPQILFLDEPTTGLDPQTRQNVWETIQSLQKQSGMTVFLTTHYMEEASGADYVAVIDGGLLAARGTPDQLREQYSSDHIRLIPKDGARLGALLKEMELSFRQSGGVFHLSVDKTMDAMPVLDRCRDFIEGFEVVAGSMDDAFLTITGKEMREA